MVISGARELGVGIAHRKGVLISHAADSSARNAGPRGELGLGSSSSEATAPALSSEVITISLALGQRKKEITAFVL